MHQQQLGRFPPAAEVRRVQMLGAARLVCCLILTGRDLCHGCAHEYTFTDWDGMTYHLRGGAVVHD
jgi:hypothetical protein